jgi:hypothetical protein
VDQVPAFSMAGKDQQRHEASSEGFLSTESTIRFSTQELGSAVEDTDGDE